MKIFDVLSKPQLLVGLDIGSSSIKLARLKKTSRGIELCSFDTAILPPETIVDGNIMNPKAVVEKLRALARANDCVGKKCAIAIPGHSAIVKKISLPEMTQKELAESMMWEAEHYIPFAIKDVNVDCQIVVPKAGQGQMDALLVAAKKDLVNDYLTVVRTAGFQPVVVDIDLLACQNAVALNYGFPEQGNIAIINVGASTINISVISNGVAVFARSISMGGYLLTEEIMKTLNVSWEEAEHYKTAANKESISSSAVLREVQKQHERISEVLVTEIQRSLDFFAATTIKADIMRIYLSGGASQNTAMSRSLERRLEVPVEMVDSFKNVVIDSRKFDLDLLMRERPFAAVAMGLARRFQSDSAIGPGDVRINLIGEKKQVIYFPRLPRSISVRVPFIKKRCTLTLSID
jgi:type IV pilus assembly protein PilM